MSDYSIKNLTIAGLKQPFSFDGEFLMISLADFDQFLLKETTIKSKFYALIIIESGSGNLFIDQEIHDLKKDRIFFMTYNQVFLFTEAKDCRGFAVFFTKSFYNLIYTGNRKIKNVTAFSDLPAFIDCSKSELSNFKNDFADLRKEFYSPTVLSKEILCLSLKMIMLKYIRKTGQTNYSEFKTDHKNSYIEDFRNLVEIHFKELKRTSDYAAKLTITANYLNALIKEKLDLSAENYIQNRVILEAERLLLNTALSVTEISYELGFSDKSHFGKYFKKINHDSPNNFRKQNQTEIKSNKIL